MKKIIVVTGASGGCLTLLASYDVVASGSRVNIGLTEPGSLSPALVTWTASPGFVRQP